MNNDLHKPTRCKIHPCSRVKMRGNLCLSHNIDISATKRISEWEQRAVCSHHQKIHFSTPTSCFLGRVPMGTWQPACRAPLLITLEEKHFLGRETDIAKKGECGLILLREVSKITTQSVVWNLALQKWHLCLQMLIRYREPGDIRRNNRWLGFWGGLASILWFHQSYDSMIHSPPTRTIPSPGENYLSQLIKPSGTDLMWPAGVHNGNKAFVLPLTTLHWDFSISPWKRVTLTAELCKTLISAIRKPGAVHFTDGVTTKGSYV